jgi:hypothetical protein
LQLPSILFRDSQICESLFCLLCQFRRPCPTKPSPI